MKNKKRKGNSAIREKTIRGVRARDWRREKGWRRAKRKREQRREEENTRREQTLMPPCRPQMLHQLQTSSFLLSLPFSSFPYSLLRKQRRRERQGDICRIQTYHIRVAFPAPSSLPLFLFLLPSSSFHSHLSTDSHPSGDDIGYIRIEEKRVRAE